MSANRRIPPAAAALLLIAVAIVIRQAFVRSRPGQPPRRGGTSVSTTQLVEDFSSGTGWATFASETAALRYVRGGYLLHLDRPGDDGLSMLLLPDGDWPSVVATVVVQERGAIGGLVGVGCAAGINGAYVGAVDPATSGFVILKADRSGMTLLRSGADDQGAIKPITEPNELQIQCTAHAGPSSRTEIRLLSNGRLVAAYEDTEGLGHFDGMALAGISLRRPLDAVFNRATLRATPTGTASPRVHACGLLVVAGSLEDDVAWLVDSGGAAADSPDVDVSQILRVSKEIGRISSALRSAARALGAEEGARRSLIELATRLRHQDEGLSSLAANSVKGIDTAGAFSALSCSDPGFFRLPGPVTGAPTGIPRRAKATHLTSFGRELDERLTRNLPAPSFVPDTTLPSEPTAGVPESPVDVDLRYDTFRVLGSSMEELHDSLRIHGINVRGDLVPAATFHELQPFYARNPLASGCALYPKVTLSLVITLPEWRPPAGPDRYLINQWNEYVWDLDDHERHHAGLWIRAANALVTAIVGTPPQPGCQRTEAIANARIDRVVARYIERNRAFDREVASGKLPTPSLP